MIKKTRLFCESLEQRTLFTSAAVTFASHVDFVAGTAPVALVAADFNGDANQDLAVADSGTDKVYVFFGNGTGGFSTGPVLSLSGTPSSIITGDFNGDAKPDIAVACSPAAGQTTSTVTVFLNTGSGTFGLGQITTVEAGSITGDKVAMVAGDFNKDGFVDLAVTDYDTESVAILLGNGTGSFASPDNYEADSHPTAIATGDFNGDGYSDLAVTNTITDLSGDTTNSVAILTGSSTASFTAGANIAIADTGTAVSIIPASLSSSIEPGLVTVNTDGTATVLTNADGTFTAATQANVGPEASAIAEGDFNLDGNVGYVASNGGVSASTSNDSVTVLPGTGNGNVSGTTQFPTGEQPVGVVVADFNNDGKPDIATVNEASGTVSVLLNDTVIPLVTTTTVLTTSSSSTPADSTLTLTATITGATPSVVPGATDPTGTVDFYDGSTLLGAAAIAANTNQATFTTTSLIVGAHQLHAIYLGDDAFATSTSAHVAETIAPTATAGPDLVGTFVSSSFGDQVAPGQIGTVSIRVTNQGTTNAVGPITNELYLSLDTLLDSGDTLLIVRGMLAHTTVHLKPGQSTVLPGTVTIPLDTPLATYSLLTLLNSTNSIAESTIANNLVISPATYAVADVFGTVGGTRNVSLQVADLNGTVATFKLTGPGTGTVNVGDSGVDLLLDGTTAASTLTITSKGAVFQINNLSADSAIRSVTATDVAVNQSLTLPGGVSTLSLSSFGTTTANTITLGSGAQSTISLGSVPAATLTAASGIKSLSVGSWGAGTITAPSIASLRSTGAFSSDVTVAGNIGTVSIRGNLANAEIDSDANIASVTISGSVSNSQILAGLTSAATLGSLRVTGSLSTSLVGAGATPTGGTTSGLPAILLGTNGTIRSITILGPVDSASQFLAATDPKLAILGGTKVIPSSDPRFKLG